MKKEIKTIALSFIASSILLTSFNSCTKPLKVVTPDVVNDIAQGQKSIPISCKFNGNNTEMGCTNELGFCLKTVANVEELNALTLATDEGKGLGFARKLADGNILLTLNLGTTNISENQLAKWIDQKSIELASNCLLPNTVLENCLRTDKIVFPPNAKCVIPKGMHPLTVSLSSTSLKTPEVVLNITLNAKCDYVGHVTLLR